MPNDATIEECQKAYELSWSLGIKANALYRDGSKLSQPLAALIEEDDDAADILEGGTPHEKSITLAEKIVEKIIVKDTLLLIEKKCRKDERGIRKRHLLVVTKCIFERESMKTAT